MYTMIVSKEQKIEIKESNDWTDLCVAAWQLGPQDGQRIQYWNESNQDWQDFDFGY